MELKGPACSAYTDGRNGGERRRDGQEREAWEEQPVAPSVLKHTQTQTECHSGFPTGTLCNLHRVPLTWCVCVCVHFGGVFAGGSPYSHGCSCDQAE